MKAVFFRSLILVTVVACSGCDLQKNMLYYPDPHVPSAAELAADRLRFWPSGPENYRGFASADRNTGKKGTIVVLHGNAGTAADRAYYVQALAPLGFQVILAEYPGYGRRRGEPAEDLFVQDASETLRLAREHHGGPLYLLGESLGCAVAAAAIKQSGTGIDGVILITPWDNLLSVAKGKFPWLPVRLFLTDTYDTIANLTDFPGPIAIVGAEQDQVIPLVHAEKLYRSLPGRKRMWTIRGAGHNNWLSAVGPAWWQEVADFVTDGTS